MATTIPPGTVHIPGVDTFDAGVMPDPFDERDLIYRPMLGTLPDRLDQRDGRYVMLQQGNSCTGHALAAVVNTRLGGWHVSPYMLYHLARRYDEFDGEEDVGSSLRGALKGWYHHGVLPEQAWPDLVTSPAPDLTDAGVRAECGKIPIGAYYRVMPLHLDDMQSAIAELGAVCASGLVHEGWITPEVEQHDGDKIHVIRRRDGHQPLGGHAYALVGYNDVGFLVQNSWGTSWGKGGYATLPYEDWQETAYDAWAARRGVPGTPLASGARITGGAGGERTVSAPGPDPLLLSKHVVNLGNDGRLSTGGRFASSPQQIDGLFTAMADQHARWERERPGYTTRQIVFYAHGGLTSEASGLSIAQANLGWWLRNGVYPVSFAWQSGPVETLLNQLGDLVGARLPAGLGFDFAEAADRAVEILARVNFTWAWRQMKQNAAAASANQTEPVRWDALRSDNPGATLTALRLRDYLSRHPNTKLHLVGHSAGSNFLAALCARLDNLAIPIESLTYLAPALRVDEFKATVLPLMRSNRIRSFASFAMSDSLERDDVCGAGAVTIYRKSILYLVSRAFEGARDGGEVPILGMEKFADQALRTAVTANRGTMVFARSFTPFTSRCDAASHVSFDADTATMTSVLLRILGKDQLIGPENFYQRIS
ncbi:C1 family peptidase [Nonomuraea sp. NPDC048916]|uniref:C1 family peptidase n=1 Tax=Nonomuraea sp. NPDC048916 TaxID=3154232 RepID=UPI0033D5FB28